MVYMALRMGIAMRLYNFQRLKSFFAMFCKRQNVCDHLKILYNLSISFWLFIIKGFIALKAFFSQK